VVQSSDQIQEEGWEVQDGFTHVRRVVNSGEPLKVEEGGKREAVRECDLNVFFFLLGPSFAAEDDI